jgi:hypothetical protein
MNYGNEIIRYFTEDDNDHVNVHFETEQTAVNTK